MVVITITSTTTSKCLPIGTFFALSPEPPIHLLQYAIFGRHRMQALARLQTTKANFDRQLSSLCRQLAAMVNEIEALRSLNDQLYRAGVRELLNRKSSNSSTSSSSSSSEQQKTSSTSSSPPPKRSSLKVLSKQKAIRRSDDEEEEEEVEVDSRWLKRWHHQKSPTVESSPDNDN
ncbi:hypothetical protein TYRP_009581 [Tyrophagus putrescentiae]|nr:hypothetical protein TYRP_009581 [Tyrophagus putrescentiae]